MLDRSAFEMERLLFRVRLKDLIEGILTDQITKESPTDCALLEIDLGGRLLSLVKERECTSKIRAYNSLYNSEQIEEFQTPAKLLAPVYVAGLCYRFQS